MVPPGPLGEAQLAGLLREFEDYARLFNAWRGDAEERQLAIDVEIDGIRLQGRVDGVWGDGLGRIRPGPPGGNSQIRDGLDWLVANAAGHRLALVQFQDVGEGLQPAERKPLKPGIARDVLRDLLQLRARGLVQPLPWGPYTGWSYYGAETPEAALKKARDRWEGGYQRWGERDGDAYRLTLRGRDLFDDRPAFDAFVDTTYRVFRAVVEGRVFDGVVDETETPA